MIEESVLENDRRGNFVRVYPNDAHLTTYRNFFEEERKSDTTLFNYIYVGKYRNMLVDQASTRMVGGDSSKRQRNLT